MKKISVIALKGGVGKSSVVAGLGLALVDKGYKVGLFDVDVTGSNLYSALGLSHSPKWELDTPNRRVIVPEVNGYWLLSIASYVGEDYAVLWEGSHHAELTKARDMAWMLIEMLDTMLTKREWIEKVIRQDFCYYTMQLNDIGRIIDDVLASSKWRFVTELLSEIIIWPEPLDFMIADLPPSTSNEMFSFLDQVKDLFGVIIVSQPAKISVTGLLRTIDLLRQKQIPIIGLVANQDGFLNCHGEVEYQFLSPRVDLEQVAREAKIPFLASIPQTGDSDKLKPYFRQLAERVIVAKPIVLKEVTTARKLKRMVAKGIARRL